MPMKLILVAGMLSLVVGACTGAPGTPAATPLASTAATAEVAGHVAAGPVCPVERPGDSACAPRPVAGAILVVQGGDGHEVTRVTTDTGGLFRISLAPGDYTLVPQPVQGLMGTARPMPFSVQAGEPTALEVSYDTGIR
jgi:hypothetical protein